MIQISHQGTCTDLLPFGQSGTGPRYRRVSTNNVEFCSTVPLTSSSAHTFSKHNINWNTNTQKENGPRRAISTRTSASALPCCAKRWASSSLVPLCAVICHFEYHFDKRNPMGAVHTIARCDRSIRTVWRLRGISETRQGSINPTHRSKIQGRDKAHSVCLVRLHDKK